MRTLLPIAIAASITPCALADLIGIGGGGIILEPNPPINTPIPGAVTATVVQGFNEQQNVTLPGALTVFDLTTAAPAVIAPGTVVSSHFVYFDPAESGSVQVSVGVDAVIIGVIFDDTGMDSTHSLFARAGLNYPGFIAAYGLELSTDSVTFFSPNVVRFTATAANPGDHFRIITAGVPAPGAFATALALMTVGTRRSRRAV